MDCKTAKKKIDFYFSGTGMASQKQNHALNDALFNHMTLGSTIGKHNISCQSCWDYYQKMKQHYCGG